VCCGGNVFRATLIAGKGVVTEIIQFMCRVLSLVVQAAGSRLAIRISAINFTGCRSAQLYTATTCLLCFQTYVAVGVCSNACTRAGGGQWDLTVDACTVRSH
jgi:hypothetical protein